MIHSKNQINRINSKLFMKQQNKKEYKYRASKYKYNFIETAQMKFLEKKKEILYHYLKK